MAHEIAASRLVNPYWRDGTLLKLTARQGLLGGLNVAPISKRGANACLGESDLRRLDKARAHGAFHWLLLNCLPPMLKFAVWFQHRWWL
mmetsp:Transcript_134451/g.374722  ORF Transcript_134451/g.374722 Transcript_134451/m.374722 type:complete len:89 (-) Transcript_134451:403-669(-)